MALPQITLKAIDVLKVTWQEAKAYKHKHSYARTHPVAVFAPTADTLPLEFVVKKSHLYAQTACKTKNKICSRSYVHVFNVYIPLLSEHH